MKKKRIKKHTFFLNFKLYIALDWLIVKIILISQF